MPMKPVTVRRWEIVVAFLAVTLAFVGAVVWLTHLSHEVDRKNRERIADIQQSRREGCVHVYESFREVFKPLLPPPLTRTERQRQNITKFNNVLDRLEAKCQQRVK